MAENNIISEMDFIEKIIFSLETFWVLLKIVQKLRDGLDDEGLEVCKSHMKKR